MAKTCTAAELREAYRSIPKEAREENQSFSIRVWRALSWLERAESIETLDHEGRFISFWICFNALYGRLAEDGHAWGDREAWNAFLSGIWRIDQEHSIGKAMGGRQIQILRLIDNEFLCADYWTQKGVAKKQVHRDAKMANVAFGTSKMYPVLQALFERLYVMRVQIFHGASTKGSKLNRNTLRGCVFALQTLMPAMIKVMLDHGTVVDWGDVCFAPQ